MISNRDLIAAAVKILRPYVGEDERLHGDVAAAVLSMEGEVYYGVCVDTPGWGVCAERSALAAMITAGCYRFQRIVAVWRDENTGKIHVLPPCGICRDFMQSIDRRNLDADVVLGLEETKALRDLIPYHEWPPAIEL